MDVTISSGEHFVKETVGIVKKLRGEVVYQTVCIYFGGIPDYYQSTTGLSTEA